MKHYGHLWWFIAHRIFEMKIFMQLVMQLIHLGTNYVLDAIMIVNQALLNIS